MVGARFDNPRLPFGFTQGLSTNVDDHAWRLEEA